MKEKIKKILPFLLFGIGCIIIWQLIPKCSGPYTPPVVGVNDLLKAKIRTEVKAGDSLKKVEKKSDSVRIVYKIKWLKAKEEIKYLPCDSALKKIVFICDTVIRVDSIEIVNLKNLITNKDTIIAHQFEVIKNDSIDIVGYKKEICKQKRQKKFIAAGLGALLILSAVRK